MMGYLDNNERISEDSGSNASQEEDMNDVGEVILETEGELNDSQKELKLVDEEGEMKVLS